jgi:serine/threonine-protein kinase
VIGTAQYLSPEQARGETVDARSDLYSAGCLMYELLVGRPPFTGESPVSVAYQHVREAPVPPSQLDPAIGPDIDAIVLKALAKEPDDRYQSAREMKSDITRVLAGEQATVALAPTTARPAVGAAYADPDATRVVPAATPIPSPNRMLPGSGPEDLDEDEVEPRRKRTGLVVGLITAIVLVLAALGVGGWWWYNNNNQQAAAPPPTKVSVPSVIGMDRTRVESELKSKNLDANIVGVNGPDDGTKNTATDQDPQAGARVSPGSTVKVEINNGPKTGTIPTDLRGIKAKKAESLLEDAGFDSENIKRVDAQQPEPLDAEKGEVLAVDPGEGETVPVDTEITLTVATGESEVPSLLGKLADAAAQEAEKAGFKTETKTVEDDNNPEGIVIDQSIEAGKLEDRGTTIVISIAKPKPQKTPPVTPPASPSGTPASPSSSPTASSSGG